MNLSFKIKSSISALWLLLKSLGVFKTVRVLFFMAAKGLKGMPWKVLPPPEDKKEKLSREQAGPAVLLYRGLISCLPEEEAFALTAKIILESSVIFLETIIPLLTPDSISSMSKDEGLGYITNIADKFFNADMGRIDHDETSFSYQVTRCRFPELMEKVGHKELAPLFCQGDLLFFNEKQPHVTLARTVTLAKEGKPCDFHFKLKN